MLVLDGVTAAYGAVQVLRGLSFTARAGEVACLMGRNGAGKTTALRAIMGLTPASGGQITLDGAAIQTLPAHQVPLMGIGYVPQGRRLFADMTVAENIDVGLLARGKGHAVRDHVLTLFPRLRERLSQPAKTLSGGEQQMLALARALCLEPRVLLLDEPTEGLQPSMITLIRDTVMALKSQGVAVVLVEQRVDAVLMMADSVAFVENGVVAEVVVAQGLTAAAPQFQKYVGV
jgi:branched-chain amino acid transport system ATP-binding protein